MLVATYLVNLLCAAVECRGRMPPPEAYIAEYTVPPYNIETIRRSGQSGDPFNITESVELSSNNFLVDDRNSRRKRLFPFLNPLPYGNSLLTNNSLMRDQRSMPGQFQSGMNNFITAIPNFFNSISRVMQNGNSLDNSVLNFRLGRRIDHGVGRNAHGDQLPVVLLKHGGGVEGYYMGTMNGRKISAYEGIPYAEPPTGNKRFKPPVPARPWKGIRKANNPGSPCLQTHPLYIFRVTGSEDCLVANVYSPQIPYRNNDRLFPVLIFIHGGSFIYGSGSEYGPAYLLDHDVILVTFNYRLGALGFLSTDDPTMSANNGLKDQALLIEWVHDNIRSFGGDPTRVTISGQSAGGVSSHLHLIANKVTDYFHSGISLSGSAFGFWPVLTRQRALRLTKSLAKRLNCPYTSSVELIRCLRGISGSWIIMTQLHLFVRSLISQPINYEIDWIPFHPLVLFAPVVEPEGPDAYLTKWPEDAYAKKEVARKPWIFGQTYKEGHFETYLLKLFMQSPNMALNGKRYLPMILDYDYYTTEPTTTQLTETLMRYYDGNGRKNGLSMETISDMYTDRYFSNTLHKAIHAHSYIAPTKTYAYIFNFTGKYNLGELFGVPRSEWSSAHTEDCMMIFNSSSYHHGLSKRDVEYQLSEIMTNVVSNFVATGKPEYRDRNNKIVEMWDNAVDFLDGLGPRIRYLRFGSSVNMIDDPYHERVKFWEKLRIPT